ncbi:molybdenum cofactor synthesis domain [Methanococcus vannielii SB]|uniref:Molybdenum cofactor synthesis domain n=1 Tax=Methanococcus vannielii (strain ATCC 35089 / DSM 1224 / JCM 13029 / OCM 148 / SB) TaxID=406327 RepID=A6UQR0_METVS|nr:molybdopterin-binding protein [Methanococcus vannielii]ABR54832.1 molybdenum cofactor synthesis domain [Methanococcus vannielii SB]
MKYVKELISYNNAKKIVFNKLEEFLSDKFLEVDIFKALGKICFEDIYSPCNLPMFNKSAMDGYAVIAEDTFGASETNPIILNLVKEGHLNEEEAFRLSTGMKLPKNSNAVVMKEYTKDHETFVEVISGVYPNENVSKIGEDLKKGDIVLKKGETITPYHIALLSSIGMKKIKCYSLNIGIISTGDELLDIEDLIDLKQLEENEMIVNSNVLMLSDLVRELGLTVKPYKKAPDNPEFIEKAIKLALLENDIVVTTGGTSVGDRDYTIEKISEMGNLLFHGVQLRPGRPAGFLECEFNGKKRLIFVLSGYPVASGIQFELFIRSYFKPRKSINLPLNRNIASSLGRTDILRVKIVEEDGISKIEPLRISGSGILSSMTLASGYIIIEENLEGYEKEDIVKVYLL